MYIPKRGADFVALLVSTSNVLDFFHEYLIIFTIRSFHSGSSNKKTVFAFFSNFILVDYVKFEKYPMHNHGLVMIFVM